MICGGECYCLGVFLGSLSVLKWNPNPLLLCLASWLNFLGPGVYSTKVVCSSLMGMYMAPKCTRQVCGKLLDLCWFTASWKIGHSICPVEDTWVVLSWWCGVSPWKQEMRSLNRDYVHGALGPNTSVHPQNVTTHSPKRIPKFTPKPLWRNERPCSGQLDLAEVLTMMDVCWIRIQWENCCDLIVQKTGLQK